MGGCLLLGDMPQLPPLGAEGDKWALKGAEGEVTAQHCPAPVTVALTYPRGGCCFW